MKHGKVTKKNQSMPKQSAKSQSLKKCPKNIGKPREDKCERWNKRRVRRKKKQKKKKEEKENRQDGYKEREKGQEDV